MMRAVLGLGVVVVLWAGEARADAPDPATTRQEDIEFLLWSEDSAQYLLKVRNANNPATVFQIRDTETGEIAQGRNAVATANGHDEEVKTLKKLVKAWKLTQAPVVEAVNPRKSHIMVMTGQKKDKFLVMGLNGDRATRYESFEVMQDAGGQAAKAFQKQLVWDQDGRHLAIVYRTKLEGETPFEGDMVYVTKFKATRVKAPAAADGEGGESASE
jgi:hypothetical protein